MAIQLARAIGMQGGIPQSNLPQIIEKGGDKIIGILEEEKKYKQAKAKKEQELKDAIAASIDYTGIDAHPVDNESYRNDWNKGLAYIAMQSKDPNVTSSQVAELRRKFKQEMEDKKTKYESDWKEIGKAVDAQGKTHETAHFQDYVNLGKEGKDTMVAKEKDDEGGLEFNIEKKGAVPALVQLPWQERKKIDLRKKFEELAVPILPNTIDVAKSIPSFGKDFEYKDYVTTTTTKGGGLDYSIDEDKIKKDAEFFANETAERKLTPYSDKFMQYQNSLTKLVGKKVASELPEDQLEAGGDILKNEVKSVAYRAFYDDAMREAKAQTIRLKEEREKSKKGGITIDFGQAEKQSKYNIGEPLDERLENLKTNKVENYVYYPLQGKAEGENKLMRVVSGYGNVAIDGVYRNKETNQIDWIKITVPEKTKTKNGKKTVIEEAKTKYVKPTARQIADISAEVGDKYFYGKTEAAKPISETMPKQQATKPAATETKRIKSDGSDLNNWSTSNEYEVGGKIYYYDKSTKQWQKK